MYEESQGKRFFAPLRMTERCYFVTVSFSIRQFFYKTTNIFNEAFLPSILCNLLNNRASHDHSIGCLRNCFDLRGRGDAKTNAQWFSGQLFGGFYIPK